MNTYCPYCMHETVSGKPCPNCGKKEYHPSKHQFPPGVLLHERYVLGRTLGSGGFGITYLGLDTALNRQVAVKEYFPNVFVYRDTSVSLSVTCYDGEKRKYYEKGRERFLQEARVLASLDEVPEIVQVLDCFAANNTVYIVMQLLKGRTLADILKEKKRIPSERLFEIMKPLLHGMNQMHGAGIIHRDISPDNIMLMDNGKPKLMDFGCARDLDGESTMTVMLKHGYAPPEQYSGHNQGPWTDIYALCATCYCCLTGQRPPDAMKRLVKDTLLLPSQLGVDIPREREQALKKGLAVNAEDRWQSVAQLYKALYHETIPELPWSGEDPDMQETVLVTDEPMPESGTVLETVLEPEPIPEPKPRKKKHFPKGAIICGTGAVLAILAGGLYLCSTVSNTSSDTPDSSPSASVSASINNGEDTDDSDSSLPALASTSFPTIVTGNYTTIGLRADGTVVAAGSNLFGECDVGDWKDIVSVAIGRNHTVGLRSDGTVVAAGDNNYGQCNVDDWTDIVAVAAGADHTVGLRSDGTVVATGSNEFGEINVDDWTDIVAVITDPKSKDSAYESTYTIGLRSDGTVVATGSNEYGEIDVDDWTDIIAIDTEVVQTVGLRSDGTVVTTGKRFVELNADDWTDITAISVGANLTVGLRSDGTVAFEGPLVNDDNVNAKSNITGWTDIVAVANGWYNVAGLRSDGTVVAVGDNNYGQCNVDGWTDIVAIAAGSEHIVGLRSDGTVVAVGNNDFYQCDVSDWTDIRLPSQGVAE